MKHIVCDIYSDVQIHYVKGAHKIREAELEMPPIETLA